MIGSAAYADHKKGLQQNADREGIHGEAGSVDLDAEYVDHTLSIIFVLAIAAAASYTIVGLQDAVLAREGFEEDRDE